VGITAPYLCEIYFNIAPLSTLMYSKLCTSLGVGGGREGKKSSRLRWKYIKVDLPKIGWEDVNWIDLVQDRNKW